MKDLISNNDCTNLVVGAGISGAVVANYLAVKMNQKVTLIDRRENLGGNCYDYFDKNGICIHAYGAHIFHTDNEFVWSYLSEYTKWEPYMHEVVGVIDGKRVPIPFNLNALHIVFPEWFADSIERKLIQKFGYNVKVPILELKKFTDPDLKFLADYIYEKVFLQYTMKQWGKKPEEIAPEITERVPIYISRDNRYFQNRYQGIPRYGYTKLIENLLDHPNIEIKLNTCFKPQMLKTNQRCFYSGSIDNFFEYCFGTLPYRSLNFEMVEYNKEFYQEYAVINYPENYTFTRTLEYKHFLRQLSNKTVVSFEYPQPYERNVNEPFYPLLDKESRNLYQKYLDKAKQLENVFFLGRLGAYQYYDMDKAVETALKLMKRLYGKKDIL